MTDLQKDIISKLLLGYTIANCGPNGLRLHSPEMVVYRKVNTMTFTLIKPLLRKRDGIYLINKSKVRQLHGKTWIKRQYKKLISGTNKNKPQNHDTSSD